MNFSEGFILEETGSESESKLEELMQEEKQLIDDLGVLRTTDAALDTGKEKYGSEELERRISQLE